MDHSHAAPTSTVLKTGFGFDAIMRKTDTTGFMTWYARSSRIGAGDTTGLDPAPRFEFQRAA